MTDKQNLEYAIRLATTLWKKYYKTDAPHWKPFDDMSGVLSQIDNMIAGIMIKDGKIRNDMTLEDPPWELPKCEYCNQPIKDVKKHYTECRLAHMNAVIKAKNKSKKKNIYGY